MINTIPAHMIPLWNISTASDNIPITVVAYTDMVTAVLNPSLLKATLDITVTGCNWSCMLKY